MLIFLILLVVMATFTLSLLFGNPVTRLLARAKAAEYISQNYKDLDLKIEGTGYSFNGNYEVYVKSKTSMDTRFSLVYWDGRIQYSTFDNNVRSGQNTFDRLSKEYVKHVTPFLKNAFGDKFRYVNFYANKNSLYSENKPALDTPFEKSLLKDGCLYLSLSKLENIGSEYLAGIIEKAYEVLASKGYEFEKIEFRGESMQGYIDVHVSTDNIKSGNLANLIELAKTNENMEGIYVYLQTK